MTGKNSSEELSPEFLELERRKRYGYVNKIEEADDLYRIQMFFPTIVPPGRLREKLGLPREMPDYQYEVGLEGNTLTVKARLTDENVLKLTGIVNSFPDRFFRDFALPFEPAGCEHSYKDKVLTIIVRKKSPASQQGPRAG